jgi:hypothetical protein
VAYVFNDGFSKISSEIVFKTCPRLIRNLLYSIPVGELVMGCHSWSFVAIFYNSPTNLEKNKLFFYATNSMRIIKNQVVASIIVISTKVYPLF